MKTPHYSKPNWTIPSIIQPRFLKIVSSTLQFYTLMKRRKYCQLTQEEEDSTQHVFRKSFGDTLKHPQEIALRKKILLSPVYIEMDDYAFNYFFKVTNQVVTHIIQRGRPKSREGCDYLRVHHQSYVVSFK